MNIPQAIIAITLMQRVDKISYYFLFNLQLTSRLSCEGITINKHFTAAFWTEYKAVLTNLSVPEKKIKDYLHARIKKAGITPGELPADAVRVRQPPYGAFLSASTGAADSGFQPGGTRSGQPSSSLNPFTVSGSPGQASAVSAVPSLSLS
jgi:hypothetical protein